VPAGSVSLVQVFRERPPADVFSGAAVAAGAFDGVHLGHQAVLAETRRLATERGGSAVVLIADPLPGSPGRLLTTVEQRLELIETFAIDGVIVAGADGAPQPGSSPAGSSLAGSSLAGSSLPTATVQVPPLCLPGRDEPISSAGIRTALHRGEVGLAATMLGRPHEVWGVVEHGDHRGRAIGFPTANLALRDNLQLPSDGVYGGWYEGRRGLHLAAINLGRRPTFYDRGVRLLEAYLLDFDGDLYGDHARVRFGARLRDELKFDAVDGLVAQMHADVAAVRLLGISPIARSAKAVEGAP
jgi:riboflavin kinase/FMN adenylyltransferase